jgi:hypothetical protein
MPDPWRRPVTSVAGDRRGSGGRAIERCPRCRAIIIVIEKPQRNVKGLIKAAVDDVVAGFDALLREREATGNPTIEP